MTDDPDPVLNLYEYDDAVERAESTGAATPEQITDIEDYSRRRTKELFEKYDMEYDSDHGTAITRQLLGTVIDRHERSGDAEVDRLVDELSTEGAHGAVVIAMGMEAAMADDPPDEFYELHDRISQGERE